MNTAAHTDFFYLFFLCHGFSHNELHVFCGLKLHKHSRLLRCSCKSYRCFGVLRQKYTNKYTGRAVIQTKNAASARTQRKQRKQSRSGYFSARSRLFVVSGLAVGRRIFGRFPRKDLRAQLTVDGSRLQRHAHTHIHANTEVTQGTVCACATHFNASMAIKAYLSALVRVHGIIKMMKLILLSNQVFVYALRTYTYSHFYGVLMALPAEECMNTVALLHFEYTKMCSHTSG